MKKFLLVVAVILLIVAGYNFIILQNSKPRPEEFRDEIPAERMTGIVSTAVDEDILNPTASFVLLTDNGAKVAIDSLLVNLKKYKKRRVEIEGRWNDGRTVFSVENVMTLGQELSVKTSVKNPKLGVAFHYPSIWEMKEEEIIPGVHSVTITPYEGSEDEILIDRSENNKRLSVREWLQLDDEYRAMDRVTGTGTVYQKSAIGIAAFESVKKTSDEGKTVEFYVTRNTWVYRFRHISGDDSEKDIYRNAFYDLVQSFEFIPISESVSAVLPGTSTLPSNYRDDTQEGPVQKENTSESGTSTSLSADLKKGMTRLELRWFKAAIQYPSRWYWASRGGAYDFGDKPVEGENHLFRLTKNPATLPEMSSIGELGGKPATMGEMAESVSVCVQGENKYCLTGRSDIEGLIDIMKSMLGTLEELM